MSNIVAIVGRPNVGKSTFFNRLIQRREAIVDAVSGVTRDRHYGKSDWNGKEFSLIDTGGYVLGSDDVFEAEIDKQVELAIEEADAIIFAAGMSKAGSIFLSAALDLAMVGGSMKFKKCVAVKKDWRPDIRNTATQKRWQFGFLCGAALPGLFFPEKTRPWCFCSLKQCFLHSTKTILNGTTLDRRGLKCLCVRIQYGTKWMDRKLKNRS